jgi:hypothetical protein
MTVNKKRTLKLRVLFLFTYLYFDSALLFEAYQEVYRFSYRAR